MLAVLKKRGSTYRLPWRHRGGRSSLALGGGWERNLKVSMEVLFRNPITRSRMFGRQQVKNEKAWCVEIVG